MSVFSDLKSGIKFVSKDGTIAFMDENRLNEYKLAHPNKIKLIMSSPVIFENPNRENAILCSYKTALAKIYNKKYGYKRLNSEALGVNNV